MPNPLSPTRPKPRAKTRRVLVLVLPHVHLQDLAGPVQAFYEANGFGAAYRLRYCGPTRSVESAQGLRLAGLEPLPEPRQADLVLVPGMDSATLDRFERPALVFLRRAAAAGARLASVCSGAFALARAGLLDGRACTTHWKVLERLKVECPSARVWPDRLFVKDGRIVTSAGVASGIDMALALIEEDHGPLLVARVAREMVVYMRRDGQHSQQSVYLDHRTHLHPGMHRVQDHLVAHPEQRPTLDELARLAGLSRRHLTRQFRTSTGITLKDFSQRIKLQVAQDLMASPELSLEGIAERCGFADARQLRRLWRRHFGTSVSTWRSTRGAASHHIH